MVLHVRGVVLPEGEERDLFLDGDRITFDPIAGAETVVSRGWLVPGLVDAHTHPGAENPGDSLDHDLLRRHGRQHVHAGALLLRVPGSAGPLPAWFGEDPDVPRVRAAGTWLAAPGGFFPGWGSQMDPELLPAAAEAEARASGDWCKVVCDWVQGSGPDRGYRPTLTPELLAAVVARVHQAGGRVAVHAMHRDGCSAAVDAGVDSLEHGTHLDEALLDTMAAAGIALVPTLTALASSVSAAAAPGPRRGFAGFLEDGARRAPHLVQAAHDAGVLLMAGTDGALHGDIVHEIQALAAAGVPAPAALAAGSWAARRFLGLAGIEEGGPADIVAYGRDPREDLSVLHEPARVILRGRIVR